MRRFFDRYKSLIVWIMVTGFFLGAAVFAAFRYVGPSSGQNSSSQETKKTAIVVNGEEITQKRLNSAYENTVERQKQLYSQFGRDFSKQLEGAAGALRKLDIKSKVADQLIKNTLLLQEAEKRGISPSKSTVDQKLNSQINKILNNYDWTEEDLKTALQRQGSTYKKFKKNLRESIRTQIKTKKVKNQVVGKVDPTDEELKTYLENNMDNYVQTPARVKTSHIVTDTQTEAQKIWKKVTAGKAKFDELAEEYMEEPSMGWFKKGKKDKKIEEKAFSMKVGEVSEPVETSTGWEILKLKDKRERKEPTLQEIKEKVRKDYVKEEESERFNKWYEDYKEKAKIEYKLPLLSARKTYEKDADKGLEAYKELKEEEGYRHPYLSYYIGRIYQEKMKKKSEKLSGEEKVQTESIKKEIETYKDKALNNYMEVIKNKGKGDLKLLRRVWSLNRSDPTVNYLLAEEYAKQMNMNRAIMHYKSAIENKSGYVKALVGYGDFLRKISRYEKASQQYEKAIEAEDNNTVRNKLAQTLLKMGKIEGAKRNFEKVLSRAEENFSALRGVGDVAFEQNNLEKAIEYYNKALEIKPDREVQIKLGRAYLQNGDTKEAETEFESVISTHPYSGKAYLGLGNVYQERDLQEKALQNYQDGLARTDDEDTELQLSKKIAELKPSDIENRLKLANIYKDKHIYNSSIKEFQKVLELDSTKQQKREAYLGLGNCYIKKTQYDKAKQKFNKGLELAETSQEKLTLYKRILKADEEQFGEEKLSSEGKNALLRMAAININQGQKEKAKEKLDRLTKIDKDFEAEKVKILKDKISSN